MTDVVPPVVNETAEEQKLGTLRGRFGRPREIGQPFRKVAAKIAVPLLVIAGALALLAAVLTKANGEDGRTATIIEVAAAAGVAFLGWGLWALRNRRRALYLYSGGLVVTGANGRVAWSADWTDVVVHWAALEGRGGVEHRLVTEDETLMRFRLKNRRQELSRQLRRLSAKAKLEEVNGLLESGKSMGLGPLVVDSSGVTHDDTTLTWPQVKKISVVQGHLVVKGVDDTGTIKVTADEVPDLALLMMIQPE